MSDPGKSKSNLVPGDQVYFSWDVLIIDPAKHSIGRVLAESLAGVMEACAEQMTRYYPNDEERFEFAEAVRRDMATPAYQLYGNM